MRFLALPIALVSFARLNLSDLSTPFDLSFFPTFYPSLPPLTLFFGLYFLVSSVWLRLVLGFSCVVQLRVLRFTAEQLVEFCMFHQDLVCLRCFRSAHGFTARLLKDLLLLFLCLILLALRPPVPLLSGTSHRGFVHLTLHPKVMMLSSISLISSARIIHFSSVLPFC